MNWLKENWFKAFLVIVILVLSIEIFFVLYPNMIEGYQLFKSYTPRDVFLPNDGSEKQIEAVNPFGK